MPGPLTSEREGRSASGVTVVGHPLRLIGGIIYRLVTTSTGTRACSVSFRASSGVIFTTRIEPSSDITTCFFILLILSPLLGLVIAHDLVRVKYQSNMRIWPVATAPPQQTPIQVWKGMLSAVHVLPSVESKLPAEDCGSTTNMPSPYPIAP